MGVPKFYRWISERYPKINEIVSDAALLPEFDHLYLDMNGIIHGCTHPNDRAVSDVPSERDMMLGIMHYLDRIISQIVKPKVSLYMAIDGVAPRAKLNQQRSRRFRSAKELGDAKKEIEKENRKLGINGDNDDGRKSTEVFDSNCITPGTEFMERVSNTIKYFIRKKIKEDPLWRNLQVIFSGHEIPGEGEHKIMDHIRQMKNQPNYRPNTRHCIYGQDADLIMLGLVTHEPHFTILREVVDFNFNRSSKNALKQVKKFTKESDFQLLHLSVLREYLDMDFCRHLANTTGMQDDESDFPAAPANQPTEPIFDLERTVDDFVFLTFLVGNDFLPHLTTLDISEGAFDLLFGEYKKQRPSWGKGEYLTSSGDISDAARLEKFIAAIGAVETATLEKREEDDAEFLKKKRRWDKRDGITGGPTDKELKDAENKKQNDFVSVMENLLAKHPPSTTKYVDGWKPTPPGGKDFKGRYYYEKMGMTPIDIEAHHNLRKAYMEGLMWCLAYYYRGCISWGWFYPYHYGPMLSDLIKLPQLFDEIKFEIGKPLLPFQQLMGCLPPASSILVPKPYRTLMTSPQSPIISFYPTDFEVDMNGKRNPWEGVNLLPFIDADLLKSSIAQHCPDSKLTPGERKRNSIGKVFCYSYDETCTETVQSPNAKIGLPDIIKCHSKISIIDEPDNVNVSFRPELVPGTRIPYPGFPALKVIPVASVQMMPIGLNVFGTPSKYPTLLLKLHEIPQIPPIEVLAKNVLGRSLFINWPMMHEGKVVAVSNETCEIRVGKSKPQTKKFNDVQRDEWLSEAELMKQGYLGGTGVPGSGSVDIGDIRIRLSLLPLQGMKTNNANGATKKVFGHEEANVPLQLALWQSPAPDPRFVEKGPVSIHDRFSVGSRVVLTKGKYRGCRGVVAGVADNTKLGVKVDVMPPEVPFGLALARSVKESFVSSSDAAKVLRMHPGILGKIAGSLFVDPGKYDLGLNLKSPSGMYVAGYTRRKEEQHDTGKRINGHKTASAWETGDSLLVIGSARAPSLTGPEEKGEKIIWEYTPKAIRLINVYRQQFPKLFKYIADYPNEKRYDGNKIFGSNGVEQLAAVRDWLNKVDSATIPRYPITTDTMSNEAIAAVEKAADVRTIAIKKKGFPKETLIKIPTTALYRENAIGATDVIFASDNNNSAPELGDRIVNLCANGVPFGAKGTVVGVHESTTGCVEVVMDQEFIGGTALQGACSAFRGKLCVWAHLLKISVENEDQAISKIVPKGAGKTALDAISKEVDQGVSKETQNRSVFASGPSTARSVSAQPGRATQTTPTRQARPQSTGRPGSAGRGKQGVWREALGPPENGIGFKGKRQTSKSGLAHWKTLMKNGKTSGRVAAPKSEKKSAELKALLGVTQQAVTPKTNPQQQVVNGNGQSATDKAAADLKAVLLGNGNADTSSAANATAGLKAMLGVTPPRPEPPTVEMDDGFPSPPPPPTFEPSAADKLLQMMSNQQPHPVPPPMHAPTAFNFTYVEEGKEASTPPPHNVGVGFPPPPSVPPMAMPMPAYGQMAPHPMQMAQGVPFVHPMHPMHPMMAPTAYGMPVQNIIPNGANIPSESEFPPLGAPAIPSEKEVQKTAAPARTGHAMIPSNVKQR